MPGQIIPITDLASGGVIADTPSLALGPNMFSDVMNVRFKDSAVRKMEGELTLLTPASGNEIVHIAWWPHPDLAPDNGYYVLVVRDELFNPVQDIVYIFEAKDTTGATDLPRVVNDNAWGTIVDSQPTWQSLLFDGGRTLIMNNGIETPRYVNVVDTGFLALPGWDSYLVNEPIITSLIWNPVDEEENINLGVEADLTGSGVGNIPTTAIAAATDYRVRNDVAIIGTPEEWATMFTRDGATITVRPEAGADLTSLATLPATLLNLGNVARIGDQKVVMTVSPVDADLNYQVFELDDVLEPINFGFSLFTDTESMTNFIIPAVRRLNEDGSIAQEGVANGDTINISILNLPQIQVRCGTLRAFGQFLVAGNLTETRADDPLRVVRRLAGTVRTSDVAPPGTVPANWNPFKIGANTADEFTLSSTGIVQDMAVLQGNLMIYTNDSIHSLQNTGNSTIPFALRPVSESYGCQTKDAVLEFDGRHVVIGSNDIYQFQGHPGSIASIADARVRRLFFDNLRPDNEQLLFMLINRREDEIWINYPHIGDDFANVRCTRSLVWNYRDNTWTIRKMTSFYNGVMAPFSDNGTVNPNIYQPLLTSGSDVFVADAGNYTDADGDEYVSYVERQRLALTPEFDTETLLSMAILAEPSTPTNATVPGEATLTVNTQGTFAPAALPLGLDQAAAAAALDTTIQSQTFVINAEATMTEPQMMEYKSDHRTQGRFLNYRISDDGRLGQQGWNLIGMQFEVGKGGTR